jgi:uncharacterized protein (DUF2336 family)
MIVRQFLQWARTAPAGERAEATSALARAYLYSNLSADDRAAAEGAMLMLLDDSSPLVRRALAEALAGSDEAPPTVVHSLAADQIEIAAVVLGRSPLFVDSDLLELIATAPPQLQEAIAGRPTLPSAVCAALAEIGSAMTCLILLENPGAEIAAKSFERIAERHGDYPLLRGVLLARGDLPAATRQALVARLSDSLVNYITARDWLAEERARKVVREACEKATVTVAANASAGAIRPLIQHLRQTNQLTPGLLLRALLSGNLALFEEALAELSGLALSHVAGIVHDRRGGGFRALYDKARLPASAYNAFRIAVETLREDTSQLEPGGASRLRRRMVERVLTGCASETLGDVKPLLTLLRRFSAEAAREEARLFCDELAADDCLSASGEMQRIAA